MSTGGVSTQIEKDSAIERLLFDTHRSRGIISDDFENYDYILAMDWDNLSNAPEGLSKKYP